MASNIDKYNEWIKSKQDNNECQVDAYSHNEGQENESRLPVFPDESLFLPEVEEYAFKLTTPCGPDFETIEKETSKHGLFAPCMVGRIEGQMLKLITRFGKAKRVLDIGTFTGYSALAFAESVPEYGQVVTIEADHKTAEIARKCFSASKHGGKIHLIEGDATMILQELLNDKDTHPFDIVFIDADKVNYLNYYEMGLQLLNDEGILIADNAMGGLVYDQQCDSAKKLHRFVEFVNMDSRVNQVLLTVREGVLVVQKKV